MNSIQHAIAAVGTASSLARQLGVTPQAVIFWRDGLRRIPADKCPAIERVTAGAVRCEALRPDVDWAFIRGTNLPPAQLPPANDAIQQEALAA